MPPLQTHYEILGVAPDCSFDELRSAYRRLARIHHPDVARSPRPSAVTEAEATAASQRMAEVNEAWKVLSDSSQRRHYDASLRVDPGTASPSGPSGPGSGGPGPGSAAGPSSARSWADSTVRSPAQPRGQRRQMWFAGVQAQMARLSRQAGRSATQTLLIRSPRATRADYEALVENLVTALSADAEYRVRAARAAGAAPLDLGVAAVLVGIRSVADGLRRQATLGLTNEQLMAAELLDRMWDVLAHELPHPLTASLGGNPCVAQALHRRS
jgi:curved DNA-binding protein CbpA